MKNEYSDGDLERIVLLALNNKLRNEEGKDGDYSEDEILDYLTNEHGFDRDVVKQALQEHKESKTGNIPLEEGNEVEKRGSEKKDSFLSFLARKGKFLFTRVAPLLALYAAGQFFGGYSRDCALENLSDYNTPVKIRDIEERERIVSNLDEIYEKHVFDDGSDIYSRWYLADMEERNYPIASGARILDTIGKNCDFWGTRYTHRLREVSLSYLDFLRDNKISLPAGERYLKLAKTVAGDGCRPIKELFKNMKRFHTEDTQKSLQ